MRTAVALVLACSVVFTGCARGGQSSGQQLQAQGSGADPGVRAALAIFALERDEERAVTAEQARKILPWLRVLAGMRPEDLEAAQAIADEVFAVLTAEQRAALERIRERARDRRPPGGEGGAPGGGAPGAQPDPARRAEFRQRAIERAIRLLEAKVPKTSP